MEKPQEVTRIHPPTVLAAPSASVRRSSGSPSSILKQATSITEKVGDEANRTMNFS